MKKNASIIFAFILFISVSLLVFGLVLPPVLHAFLYVPYVKSVGIALAFIIAAFAKRLTWKNNMVILVIIIVLAGTLLDTSGNALYNQPLVWGVSPFGELQIDQNVYNYAPGEYSITDHMRIVKNGGEVLELHPLLLYFYRFIQYLILYLVLSLPVGAIAERLPQKNRFVPSTQETLTPEIEAKLQAELEKRKEQQDKRQMLPDEVKETVWELKQNGETIKAIKMIRDNTDLSISEAKKRLEELQKPF